MTACLCLIDPATGHVSVSSAGHPAPVHLSARPVRSWTCPLAHPWAPSPNDYGASHVVLTLDDYLVLYTDGVTEARHGDELFGEERLVEVVQSLRGSSVEHDGPSHRGCRTGGSAAGCVTTFKSSWSGSPELPLLPGLLP